MNNKNKIENQKESSVKKVVYNKYIIQNIYFLILLTYKHMLRLYDDNFCFNF